MTLPTIDPQLRWKVAAAAGLAVLAAGLTLTELMMEPAPAPVERDVVQARQGSGRIDEVIDTVLARHHLDPRSMKTWAIRMPDKTVLRRESRVDVPPSFISLVFNQRLHGEMLPLGARVIATEHTKEQSVSMHVRKDGVILRTLVFRTVPGMQEKKPGLRRK